jgi:ABC-type transport system involved in multi-copper enzyme maturation permease subunit
MRGFITALHAELYVALRSTSTRVIILLPALVVLLKLLLAKVSSLTQSALQTRNSPDDFDANFDANNAYGFFVDGMSTGIILLVLTMLAFCAYSFANDRDTGVVRHLLIRRVNRLTLLLAKLCHFHLLALTSLLLLFVVTYASAALLWVFGPVIEDGYELISVAEIQTEIRLGLKLALLPLPATLAFGLLISVAAQSATQSVVTALGLLLGLDILKGMLGNGAHYIFAYYQPSIIDESYLSDVARLVRGYSDVLIDERLQTLNVWMPLPALLLFVLTAAVLIKSKKL